MIENFTSNFYYGIFHILNSRDSHSMPSYEHYNHFTPKSLTLLSVIACDMLSSRDAREAQTESRDRELLNNSSTLDLQVWQTSVGLNLHKLCKNLARKVVCLNKSARRAFTALSPYPLSCPLPAPLTPLTSGQPSLLTPTGLPHSSSSS